MKAEVYSIDGEALAPIELPDQFTEPVREDIIKRAVLAIHSHNAQPYGADPKAGTRQGYATPKRRHKYKTLYGRGVSRIKRKHLWHRGSQFGSIGAFVANAVKGRKAFPPKAEKIITERINKKENRKAICSAISATTRKELVEARNHQIKNVKSLPLIVEDSFEIQMKTKDIKTIFEKLGLKEELQRVEGRKIRAGKGKRRGRKYRTKKGPLVVVSKNCDAVRSARNIQGVEVVNVKNLNAELLAPGTQPGRLIVWTKPAVELMIKEKLFQ